LLSAALHLATSPYSLSFFSVNDTSTTEIYTLSLHDALPIWCRCPTGRRFAGCSRPRCAAPAFAPRSSTGGENWCARVRSGAAPGDRKSTRLNSSHVKISYAVFCLKKKKRELQYVINEC